MYNLVLKPLLFLIPPEKAHHFVMRLLSFLHSLPGGKTILKQLYGVKSNDLKLDLMGLHFPNPIGVAAGFDKDGKYIEILSSLGFGFIEVGTVTPLPQDGNPKPRLFRIPKDEGLINRMGFNNLGVDHLVGRLKKLRASKTGSSIIVGGNIGKNKITPNENAVQDYILCFDALHPYVDYFVVNVSSPNTPGLRELQDKKPLTELLQTLQTKNLSKTKPRPILLKIAPDLNVQQLDDIVQIVLDTKIAGIVATNTTIDRSHLTTEGELLENIGAGGVSGEPVRIASDEILGYLSERLPTETTLIGVGGISSAQHAKSKFDKGASLIQLYTGFVYEGPGLISKILQSLQR